MIDYDEVEKLVKEIVKGLNNGYRRVNLINENMNIGPLDLIINMDWKFDELLDKIEWELLFRKEIGIEYQVLRDEYGTGGDYIMFRFTKEKLKDEL